MKNSLAKIVTLIVAAGLLAATSASLTPAAAQIISEEEARQFSEHSGDTAYILNHGPWTTFLAAAVYDVGPSSRRPAPRRTGGVQTGTRVSTGSRSSYRFEANRVLFHLFDDSVVGYATAYRRGLENLMTEIDYKTLSKDEQLAYWLNLHNAIVIEQIGMHYPSSRPKNIRLRDYGNDKLYEAKIVTINGVELSLNDIRYGIVYRYWRNPDVLYGFWDGSIGSPDIQPVAYSGDNVWSVLRGGARRYVNALRGVEPASGGFRVSKIYDEGRSFFPNWPADLYAHLRSHAGNQVSALLVSPPRTLRFSRYDIAMADVNSGETTRFTGNDNIAAALTNRSEGGEGTGGPESNQPFDSNVLIKDYSPRLSGTAVRGGLSTDAIDMNIRLKEEEAKQRREGEASIEDVETEDPDKTEGTEENEGTE